MCPVFPGEMQEEEKRSKIQDPRSRKAPTPKLQDGGGNQSAQRSAWNLKFGAFLELGAWSLELYRLVLGSFFSCVFRLLMASKSAREQSGPHLAVTIQLKGSARAPRAVFRALAEHR